ncbi:hypothetical protein [Streptomyces malaysiensis]|uniref:hypothetical protein n=1 Tax=Streptomyces malaysiensis TaxID=92644 RepID=UPI0036ACF0CB
MTITPAELAGLATAPTVSRALDDAARYVADGVIPALCRAVYGSVDPSDYAVIVSAEHTLAWGIALIAAARIIDPAISGAWPDSSWGAERLAVTVGDAHRAVTGWAEGRASLEMAELFRAAAREIREVE